MSAPGRTVSRWQRVLGRHTDLALVAAMVGVLGVLFVPIPASLLDFLVLANVGFALLILLLTFYVARPVEFSTFPSLLLVATLFRLSLNVAATRLILSQADAGRVIGAIGAHVVGGNYVIGLIVFLILIVVQYVVVTNGAQRVSEVAARFTLDSMPGQQMSIDADLNMGFIDATEAQRRRRQIEKEAAFYGAMDGASKFVKGDAIAGILILLINIVGGMLIGVLQSGLRWSEALRTYTLLTIGDGIVTQVPALVIAVGTGILVTRSASDEDLGRQVLRQATGFPKPMMLVAAVLAGLATLPGIPLLPAVVVVALTLGGAWAAQRRRSDPEEEVPSGGDREGASSPAEGTVDPYRLLPVEPIEVHVGRHWAEAVAGPNPGLLERISGFRQLHAIEMGMVLPKVRFKEAPKLAPDRYEIHVDGVQVARGEVRPARWLAIHAAGVQPQVPGEPTRDPTYGLPALWIEAGHRELAAAARCTLVDAETVVVTHLTEVLRRESATLLTRAETDRLLDRVRASQPALVEELVPTVLSVGDVQKVLQGLLREKVSIRNLEAILETLADAGRHTKDTGTLIDLVRRRLGPAICQGLIGEAEAMQVITLDPVVELQLLQGLKAGDHGEATWLDPRLSEQLLARLAAQSERMMKSNLLPVLLCSPELRRQIRLLSERVLPHLRVLAVTEIPRSVELRSYAVVGTAAA